MSWTYIQMYIIYIYIYIYKVFNLHNKMKVGSSPDSLIQYLAITPWLNAYHRPTQLINILYIYIYIISNVI